MCLASTGPYGVNTFSDHKPVILHGASHHVQEDAQRSSSPRSWSGGRGIAILWFGSFSYGNARSWSATRRLFGDLRAGGDGPGLLTVTQNHKREEKGPGIVTKSETRAAEELFEQLAVCFLADPTVRQGGPGSAPLLDSGWAAGSSPCPINELIVKLSKERVDQLVVSGIGARFDQDTTGDR